MRKRETSADWALLNGKPIAKAHKLMSYIFRVSGGLPACCRYSNWIGVFLVDGARPVSSNAFLRRAQICLSVAAWVHLMNFTQLEIGLEKEAVEFKL